MDDYKINFELDSKIAQNRHRLREQFEQYKKIENYYPLFLAYIGAFGIYFFDFTVLVINEKHCIFNLLTTVTLISFIYTCYLMYDIISTKKWANDLMPSKLYKDSCDYFKHKNPNDDDFSTEKKVKEYYLTLLEDANELNFKVYDSKKKKFPLLFKIILISLVLYSVNITTYKYIKMADDNKKKEQEVPKLTPVLPVKVSTNEGVNSTGTTKTILTEQAGDSSNTGQ
jgi:hypothetical protein